MHPVHEVHETALSIIKKRREEEIIKNWNFTPQLIYYSPRKYCKSLSDVTDMLQFPIFSLPSEKRGLVKLLVFRSCSFQNINRIMDSGTPLSEKPYICVAQGKGQTLYNIFTLAHLSFLDFLDDIYRIILLWLFSRQTNKSTIPKINQKSCCIIFVYYC